ncbi:MAG: cytochrome c3 family protein [Planctomycetota bacterium]
MRRVKSRIYRDNHKTEAVKSSFRVIFFLILAALVPASIVMAGTSPTSSILVSKSVMIPLWQSNVSLISLNSAAAWKTVLSASFIGLTPMDSQRSIPLHHFDLPCSSCHDPDTATEERKRKGENLWQATVNVNQACTLAGCHNYDAMLSHPVGITVNNSEAIDLPLDSFSRVTCISCHSDPKSKQSSDDQERMLHVRNGDELCSSCHVQMQGMEKNQSHWQFSNRAHLGQIKAGEKQDTSPAVPFGSLDPESVRCLGCHEEVTATVPGLNETKSQKIARRSHMTDHPIGMEYSRVQSQSKRRFRSSHSKNERIRLFDGKVGCGSCHSLYSDYNNNLVDKDAQKSLCFQCHLG